jgi:hypothetical protein
VMSGGEISVCSSGPDRQGGFCWGIGWERGYNERRQLSFFEVLTSSGVLY